ncbi:CHAT domain-containing protein [Larkinella arboricola]
MNFKPNLIPIKQPVIQIVFHFTLLLLATSNFPLSAQSTGSIDRLRNRAEFLYSQGDYSKALIFYLKGYHLARQTDPVRAANLSVDISAIYHVQGNFRRGASICQEGLALIQQAAIQPDSVKFKIYSSLGEMYKKLGNQDSCYLYFSQANAMLQRQPELENRISDYVIYHYNNQGMMYVRSGGYKEGLGYLNKALLIAERHTTSQADIAIIYNNLGGLYEKLGEFKKALELRRSAARLYTKKDIYQYLIFSGMAWDALQLKSYAECKLYAQKAMSLSPLITRQNVSGQSLMPKTLALYYLGEYYYATGQPTRAAKTFKQVVKNHAANLSDKGANLAYSFLGLARIHRQIGQTKAALAFCQQALMASHSSFREPDLSRNPGPSGALFDQALFTSLALKAELMAEQFQTQRDVKTLQLSLATYEHALAVADFMRRSYNALDTKWFFAARVRPIYLQAFETAYLLHSHLKDTTSFQQVLNLAERSKAVVLADVTRELLIKPANVPAELVAQEREFQRKMTALKFDAARSATPPSEVNDLQIKLAQLQQRLEKEFPAYYQAKYQSQTVQLGQVQAILDDQTAYLNYAIIGEKVYIILLTKRGFDLTLKTDPQGILSTAMDHLKKALYANPGLGNYKGAQAAITCYRWLFEPIRSQLEGIKRLVVARDGALHHLPFEVFESGRVVDDFLVKKYAISYVPSITSWLNSASVGQVKHKNSLLSLAPFTKPVTEKAVPLGLPYLPASQLEIESLPGDQLMGEVATKYRFLRSYTDYELLHLATHAYAADDEPARSYIAFYPDGNPDKLYTEEIYNLSLLKTRLVVLSACKTGAGQFHTGEGFMSLAQAFAYAGCPSVVATLWSAHDGSMAYLSGRFYHYLQTGLPIDLALQRARLDYFDSDLYRKLNHPHYWTNLILVGNNSPLYPADSVVAPELYGLLLIVSLLACLVFIFQKFYLKRTTAG